eukprot:TRINITY_DN29937_c0_g1_i1.p2 TRINITY_DN29937_c0_g1~~TRINITY_DN29937_c0_g1_i1.p2  ORF type:complete len:291 (+),score=43.02 TRINITY_DN29937_c0_g1_i1:53-925(+)
MAAAESAGEALQEHGLPPRKELLVQHNAMMDRKDALRRERAEQRRASHGAATGTRPTPKSPGRALSPPPSTAGGETTLTTRSRWDDATVDECWAFIKMPHTTWNSAAKGMDITDVAPTWRKARSEVGGTSVYAESVATADGAQSVASKTTARTNATSNATSPARAAVGPPRKSSLSSLKQARQSNATAHTPDLSLAIGSGAPRKGGDAASNVSTPTSVGRPSGLSGAARARGKLSKPPVNGYSFSPTPSAVSTSDLDAEGLIIANKPAAGRTFTNSNRPRPAPRPGRMAQ